MAGQRQTLSSPPTSCHHQLAAFSVACGKVPEETRCFPSAAPVSPENKSAKILRRGCVWLFLSRGSMFLGQSRQQLAQEVMGKSYLPSPVDICVNALGSNRAEGQGF